MTLFVKTCCNKISLLVTNSFVWSFIHSLIYLFPVLNRLKTFLKGQLLVFFVLCLEVLKQLAF